MIIQDISHLILDNETKNKLQDVYYELWVPDFMYFIDEGTESQEEEDHLKLMIQLISSRITISSEGSGYPGCGTVVGFIDEVELINNLHADFDGEYRGYNAGELLEQGIVPLLDQFEVPGNTKTEIINQWKERYNIEE
jgi:hypothetical protein